MEILPRVRASIAGGRAELARLPAAALEIWEFGEKEKKGEKEKEKVGALR